MERDKQKRARESTKKVQDLKPKPKPKRPKKRATATTAAAVAIKNVTVQTKSDARQAEELGVFEFPWQKEDRPIVGDTDGCDLRDVFFSSLVDGCSAAIGFPGDRLSPFPAPIDIPDSSSPSDADLDAGDCIWSCALREPLAVCSKASLA